jgi:predicted transcriptional regulator YheO
LLYKHLPVTPPGKIKRASASKLTKWVSAALKKAAGKTVAQCCIAIALDATEELYLMRQF